LCWARFSIKVREKVRVTFRAKPMADGRVRVKATFRFRWRVMVGLQLGIRIVLRLGL
jgi:hypothetical protein